jgi:circadian clock protein KaiC
MTEANYETYEALALERVSTGTSGLDRVLGGGLFRGAIYLVMGRPGTGKTTLGNQICFSHAAAGGRAVYVTLLAESHASMIKNLRSMEFFNPALINHGLVYIGAYKALRDEKLKGLLNTLRRVIRDEKASMLVLDGISPTRTIAESDLALKEFIVELQILGSMMNCTTILLANMTADDANGPEHTMVDGLVELAFERSRRRTYRTVEVIKFRGSRHLLGRHELDIEGAGIIVHPRTEEVLDAHVANATRRRVSTGISQLDAMLGGGLLSGTTTVILGFAGSGKTTLSLQFLDAGHAAGENSLHFGFYEPPAHLLDISDALGLQLRVHARDGSFAQIWQPTYEFGIDALLERLLADVRKRDVKRVVIDGFDGVRLAAADPERTIRVVSAITNELRAMDVTTVITDETLSPYGPEIATRVEAASALFENLLLLEYMTVGTELRRLISILKQRSSEHAMSVREFKLTKHGFELAGDASSAAEILLGFNAFGGKHPRKPRSSTP